MLSKKIKKIIMVAAMIFTLLFSAVNIAHAQTNIKPFRLSESAITYYVKQEVTKPKVLIYHTHYQETYIDGSGVYDAGEDLARKLEARGIVVEHIDIDFTKGTDRTMAYIQSRKMLMSKNLNEYSLIIDYHRDAHVNSNTTIVDGKEVSKIAFVSTKENPNRSAELKIVNDITYNLELHNPKLNRGVLEYYFSGIKHYNCDLSDHSILVEMGNQYNTLTECSNANIFLAQAIADYIYINN